MVFQSGSFEQTHCATYRHVLRKARVFVRLPRVVTNIQFDFEICKTQRIYLRQDTVDIFFYFAFWEPERCKVVLPGLNFGEMTLSFAPLISSEVGVRLDWIMTGELERGRYGC